jgi:hypothetical protein
METLKFLIQSKKADHEQPLDIVRGAVDWLTNQLRNADVPFHYAEGGFGHGVYGYFQVKALLKDTAITLHIKIAEINGKAYAFSDIRVRGQQDRLLFPFFGEICGEEGRLNMLHYICDFILSTTPDVTAL